MSALTCTFAEHLNMPVQHTIHILPSFHFAYISLCYCLAITLIWVVVNLYTPLSHHYWKLLLFASFCCLFSLYRLSTLLRVLYLLLVCRLPWHYHHEHVGNIKKISNWWTDKEIKLLLDYIESNCTLTTARSLTLKKSKFNEAHATVKMKDAAQCHYKWGQVCTLLSIMAFC